MKPLVERKSSRELTSTRFLKQRIRRAAEAIMLVSHSGTSVDAIERIITMALNGDPLAPNIPAPRKKDENITDDRDDSERHGAGRLQ